MVKTVISRDIDLMVLLQNAFIVYVTDYIETNYKKFTYRSNFYFVYYYCVDANNLTLNVFFI